MTTHPTPAAAASDVTDGHLRAWRDALVAGGLPTPHRTRWQTLRAGVVNLWEFEAVEYWYADGWAQLMGRNETGKSSLMALTTLIPLLGDTSSDKIDTLGRSGKQFAYYVRPSGENDRRDADASSHHGWLWVEYGRMRDGAAEFFTTLLYASARTGSTDIRRIWCTAEGGRIRGELHLVAGREVRTPKELTPAGLVLHPNATAYREALAGRLFDSVARLESIGKLLKVTRQPKLGASLQVDFVTRHLRDSLPELNRSEIAQLAQGWDQLDQLRADVTRAQDAAAALARFERDAWRPWAGGTLRLAADDVSSRQTTFDNVTREEREAAEELAASEQAVRELTARREEVATGAATARAKATSLQASRAWQEATSRVAHARAQADRATEKGLTVQRSRQAWQEADVRATKAAETLAARRQQRDAATSTLQEREDDVQTAARDARLDCPRPLDADLLRQAAKERVMHVDEVGRLLIAADAEEAKAKLAETKADERLAAAREARARSHAAWAEAEAERDALVGALHEWAPGNAVALVRGWEAALPRSAEQSDGADLATLLRRDVQDPRHTQADEERRAARRRRQGAEAEAEILREELARLEQEGVAPPPGPVCWSRRERADEPGAPFWRVVDPVHPDQDLAALEAALAASGLLDAWARTDSGIGLDAFLRAPAETGAGSRLREVLAPADDAGEVAGLVGQVLDGVALRQPGEPLPDRGVAVSLDGRWRTPAVEGQTAAHEGQARWLGQAAREAHRRRRRSELQSAIAAAEAAAGRHRSEEERCNAQLAALGDLMALAPTDARLRKLLARCAAFDISAEAEEAQADRLAMTGQEARVAADTERATLLRTAGGHGLPTTTDGLQQVRGMLTIVDSRLMRWRQACEALDSASREAAAAAGTAETLACHAATAQEQHRADVREHELARAQAEALQAAIGTDDREIMAELARLTSQGELAEREREHLDRRHVLLADRRGGAQARLSHVAERRAEAVELRKRAHEAFRELIDLGLAATLGLDLPDAASSAVEQVRAQAAHVRRQVQLRAWSDGGTPEDRTANTSRLQALRSALEGRARDVRGELEQGGRSLEVAPDGPLLVATVVVDGHGTALPLHEANARLQAVCTELEAQYSDSVRHTLDELLGSTFLEHMRDRIGAAAHIIDDINDVLANHPTGTDGTTLRIDLAPGTNAAVLAAITGPRLMDPHVAEQVREFLKARVDEAKRAAADEGRADWRDTLAGQLDYRAWYDVSLQHRVRQGRWLPLTTRRYAELSGGARAVMLMLPLVAALAAQYRHLPDAPRPLWLDEAFDGLDAVNRSMVMSLLRRFDLDVLLAGPGRLVTVDAVPAAAIYQVVRAAAPEPGADLTAELWAGRTLEAIDLPLSWLEPRRLEAESDAEQGRLV